MIDTVKTKPPDSLLSPGIGPRVNRGRVWHLAVKAGVKHRYLRNWAEDFLNQPDRFEFDSIVQRSENRHLFDRRFHCGIDSDRLRIFRAAVDDAVPNRGNLRLVFQNS